MSPWKEVLTFHDPAPLDFSRPRRERTPTTVLGLEVGGKTPHPGRSLPSKTLQLPKIAVALYTHITQGSTLH